jgi:hypothetical protein
VSRLRPFFSFYGGKWRAAPRYPAPAYETLVEPFAGSAGYAVTHHARKVVLVERDPVIATLWSYLVRVSPSEIRSIPLLGNDQTVDDLGGAAEEARHLVGFWLNKGTPTPKRRPSAWMRLGTHVDSYWGEAIRERVASQVEAIRHWVVIDGSYDLAPDVAATWFVDPPYEGAAGRLYRHRDVDRGKLADWARARRGQTMVCETGDAAWLPFRAFGSCKSNPSRRGKGFSQERLWTQER